MPKRDKELKDSLKKVILEEALEHKMAPMETKLAFLQRETKCKAMQEYILKKPSSMKEEVPTKVLSRFSPTTCYPCGRIGHVAFS